MPARTRAVDDSSSAKTRAFLVFLVTPALILFMSRKAVDHTHPSAHATDHQAANTQYTEQWPTVAHLLPSPTRALPGRIVPSPLDPRSADVIYFRAMFLARNYDSRPYWRYPKLTPGAPINRATADLVIEHLIPCESMGRPTNGLDTNGKMSYGILQFQDWDQWERISGITGNPDNRVDAIRMAEWAIQNGMINHWTCASILKIT